MVKINLIASVIFVYCSSAAEIFTFASCRLSMPLAQAHPWQPVPVKHEEEVNEVRMYFAGTRTKSQVLKGLCVGG